MKEHFYNEHFNAVVAKSSNVPPVTTHSKPTIEKVPDMSFVSSGVAAENN